ncbi:MAG: Txe/YoeB family addiction module toxin [Nocardioides sp.]
MFLLGLVTSAIRLRPWAGRLNHQFATATSSAVINDREEVVITRSGHESVVIVSLQDFESLREAACVMGRRPRRVAFSMRWSEHDFADYWSRRITDEHRLVYKVTEGEVRIAACRYHYGQ